MGVGVDTDVKCVGLCDLCVKVKRLDPGRVESNNISEKFSLTKS